MIPLACHSPPARLFGIFRAEGIRELPLRRFAARRSIETAKARLPGTP
jgi:hypothetical protein